MFWCSNVIVIEFNGVYCLSIVIAIVAVTFNPEIPQDFVGAIDSPLIKFTSDVGTWVHAPQPLPGPPMRFLQIRSLFGGRRRGRCIFLKRENTVNSVVVFFLTYIN